MKRVIASLVAATATMICSGVVADEGDGGNETIPMKIELADNSHTVELNQPNGDAGLFDWLVDFLRATDRGG